MAEVLPSVVTKDYIGWTPKLHNGSRTAVVIGNAKNFEGSVYGKVLRHLGIQTVELSSLETQPDFAILWMNGIQGDGWGWNINRVRDDLKLLAAQWSNTFILGDQTFDDDKAVVQKVFADVAGYDLKVDPTTHVGAAVRKSRVQARHDGQVIHCPIPAGDVDDRAVYELVIDNTLDDYIIDIRLPIVMGDIPFAYLKYRPYESRFSNVNTFVKMVSASDVLSQDELELARRFASAMKLPIGEIDVLRDKVSGRIYIVDANNTPSGPPNHLSPGEADLAIRFLGDALSAGIARANADPAFRIEK